MGAGGRSTVWNVVALLQQTRPHHGLGESKQPDDGAGWELTFSWTGERRRPIRGGEDSYHNHLPAVADRTLPQRLAGQFLVEIAEVGFVLSNDGVG